MSEQVGSTPVAELGYEAARDELVRVVQQLESGAATLEESLALWERGSALADRCEEWLQGAKARLDAARTDARTDDGRADGGGDRETDAAPAGAAAADEA